MSPAIDPVVTAPNNDAVNYAVAHATPRIYAVDCVHRSAGMRTIDTHYTDAVHQYACASLYLMYSTLLRVPILGGVLTALLTHDNFETLTGDLLAPAKHIEEARWQDIESAVASAHRKNIAIAYGANALQAEKAFFPTEDELCASMSDANFSLVKAYDMFEFLVHLLLVEVCAGNTHPDVLRSLEYGGRSLFKTLTLNVKDKHVKTHFIFMRNVYAQLLRTKGFNVNTYFSRAEDEED